MTLPKINPTKTSSWQQLEENYHKEKDLEIKDLFKADPIRFDSFSASFKDILLDYSKNRITKDSLHSLIELAKECKLDEAIASMYSGKAINETEARPVLHVALRDRSDNVRPEVKSVLDKMKRFCDQVINGSWKGYTGKSITDVVNLGVGGSDLGSKMVVEALQPYRNHLNVHFISNIDEANIHPALNNLNPETTIFLIASKTFTTLETMTNAHTARDWFLQSGQEQDISKHFVAISTNENAVKTFGIDTNNMFEFWDWVGGRYSLWSAIGLSIALSVGFDQFEKLLEGAHEMDLHFKNTEFDNNLPVILALLGIWYNNFYLAESHAVLPYSHDLQSLPRFLQQLDMESNGKNIDRNGNRVSYETGSLIWGEAGTNAQHSFYQLIHQGTKLIPSDFIGLANSNYPSDDHHTKLLSNYFAQTEALMNGKSEEQVSQELSSKDMSPEEIKALLPYKCFEGNKPSNSILLKRLTPKTLGSLLAMYEHKVFTQGVIWNIYSFDQWGVELGKQLASAIYPELLSDSTITSHNQSTNGLINTYKNMLE